MVQGGWGSVGVLVPGTRQLGAGVDIWRRTEPRKAPGASLHCDFCPKVPESKKPPTVMQPLPPRRLI